MYNTLTKHPKDVYAPESSETEKKVFKVEVKDIPKEEVEEYVENVIERVTPKEIRDKISNS